MTDFVKFLNYHARIQVQMLVEPTPEGGFSVKLLNNGHVYLFDGTGKGLNLDDDKS